MNRLFLLLFGAVSLVAHAQVPDYVPTEGLVAWYPMNNSGDDGSGNGFHGEVVGSTFTTDRFGSEASSAYFDWAEVSGYGNPWHRIEINPGFDGYLEGTFSVAAWINPEHYYWPQNSAHSAMIFGYANRCPNTAGLRFSIEGEGALRLRWGNNAISEEGAVALNEWQHVVGTIATDSMRVYINGIQVGAAPAIEGPTSGCFNIGELHQANGHWYYFDGAIDDLGVWNHALTEEEILALYNAQLLSPGCTDPTACNFNDEANEDDGSCVYPLFGDDCDTGGVACGEGTIWDSASQSCVAWNDCPSDLDGDGVIGIIDLMELLSSFGTMCEDSEPETGEFTCGDPMNYHGYDYATVQIGDQCWCAENLRTTVYANGDTIPAGLTDGEWTSTTAGATAVYGEASGYCENFSPEIDACDDLQSLEEYGRLFNWYAVDDARGLCPSGWHVPTYGEWTNLENYITSQGYAGTEGTALKSNYGWTEDFFGSNGTDDFGFSALPGGSRNAGEGYFYGAGSRGYWWSSSPNGDYANGDYSWFLMLQGNYSVMPWFNGFARFGLSVRCLKD